VHKLSGECANVSDWNMIFVEILKKYAPSDIYNADKSALYYNLLLDKTLAMKDDPCKGGKHSKECMTLLQCANMDGSHKVKSHNSKICQFSSLPRCAQHPCHIQS
jgi:hypothetical protein